MLDVVMAGRPALKPAPAFGQRLAAARKERGLTQVLFAEKLGISRELVGYYERQASNPSLEFIQRAADALEIEASHLVEGHAKKAQRTGPPSKLEETLVEVKKLPRKKQEQLLRMISAFLAAEQS